MQTLWTSASGIRAQTERIDAIANDIANVDTTGYKGQDVSFEDLLTNAYTQNGPYGAAAARQGGNGVRIGDGTRVVPESTDFSQGTLEQTGKTLDFGIQGEGMFAVQVPGVGVAYTRAGAFQLSVGPNNRTTLVDAHGDAVLDSNGQPIDLTGYDANSLTVSADGTISAKDAAGALHQGIAQIQLAYITNRGQSLRSIGNDLYTLAPGYAATSQLLLATPAQLSAVGQIHQGTLEQSNVNLTNEMANLMTSQQALQLDAHAVSVSDEMMNDANNLRGQ